MTFETNAKRRTTRTQPADTQGNPTPQETRRDRVKTGQRFPWDDVKLDRNGDGRIDMDDVVFWAKEAWQWLFSWRGGMFLSAGFTLMAGSINVASWSSATGSALAGFLVFGMVQTLELMSTFDGMNVKSNLASLVRLQRKPVEIPVVNQTLNPAAKNRFKRYRNREKNQDMVLEAVKWICYGIEFSVLVVGGGILAPTGVSWGAALISLIGMVGVELGLWLVNICAEKLMTPEERAFIKELEGAVQRTSVKVASSN